MAGVYYYLGEALGELYSSIIVFSSLRVVLSFGLLLV
jgi:hypothetical protein